MDSDKVEARKSLLESFLKVRYLLVCPCELESSAQDSSVLTGGGAHQISSTCMVKLGNCLKKDLKLHLSLQQLCAVPEIANSEEVQEFLALNTDARIAFVKKPFVVSRIDKVHKCETGYLNHFWLHLDMPLGLQCLRIRLLQQ